MPSSHFTLGMINSSCPPLDLRVSGYTACRFPAHPSCQIEPRSHSELGDILALLLGWDEEEPLQATVFSKQTLQLGEVGSYPQPWL